MVLLAAKVALAQQLPSASQVMTEMGLPADAAKRVLAGEFVSTNITPVSDRDLSIALAFLVKTSPAELGKQVAAGDLAAADPQIKARGALKGAGSVADLAQLKISDATAKKFAGAKAGSALNLSTAEIAAFAAAGPSGANDQLRQMLLKRYQSYSASGLAGIPKYDRGGSSADPAADLRLATEASKGLEKYAPAFQKVLAGYPGAKPPGLTENFYWVAYDISGEPTYVLNHTMTAPDGDAVVVLQRQYYVSSGYNAVQAVVGFLPVTEGTVVLYTTHTFTEQVAGFGGGTKRSIGRGMMEKQLETIFKRAQKIVQH